MERTTAQSNRLTAGIDIIDEAWGGLYRGAAYLLYGPSAAGRGLLPLLFARSGASRGERCLYVSAGRPRDLTLQAASLGFDLRAAYDDGRVRLVRIPPVFDTSEEGDDALVNALRGLAAEAAQHRPDRLIIDDFTPFVQFRSFERFGVSLSRLFEALPEQTTLMLALGEPASAQSERVIQFVRNQVFGTLHLELTDEEAPSTRRLILIPNIGHLRHEVIDDWDLESLVESIRQDAEPETVQEETPTVDPHDFVEGAASEVPDVAEVEAAALEEDILDEAEPASPEEDWVESEEEAPAPSLEATAYETEQEEDLEDEAPTAFAQDGEMDEALTVAEEEDEPETYEAYTANGEEEISGEIEEETIEDTDEEIGADGEEADEYNAYEDLAVDTEEEVTAALEEDADDEEDAYDDEEEEPEAYEAPTLEEAEEPAYEAAEPYDAPTEEPTEEYAAFSTPDFDQESEEAGAEEALAAGLYEADDTWEWEDEDEEAPSYDASEEEAVEAIEAEVEEELKYFSTSEVLSEGEPEVELGPHDEADPSGPAADFWLGEPAEPSVRAIPLGRARDAEVTTLEPDPVGTQLEADEAHSAEPPPIGFEEDETLEPEVEEDLHEYEAFFENGGPIDEGIEEELLDAATLPEVDYTNRVEFRVRLQQHFLRLAVNNAPFVLIAMRMDRREDKRVRPFDFEFLQDLIATLLREEDDLLVDLDQERLIVLLGESDAEIAQAFFGQLKNRLRDESPHQSEYLLHSVSAIVVPNGRPFDTAEEFLTYALDQP